MTAWLPLAVLAAGTVPAAALAAFSVASLHEGERRAAWLAAAGSAAIVGISVAAAVAGGIVLQILAVALAALGALAAAALAIPFGSNPDTGGRPSVRVDERTIMFARGRLAPGSPEFEAYYRAHPEHRSGDDRTRALPGLLSPDATLFEPTAFAAAEASFAFTAALRDAVDGDIAPTRVESGPDERSAVLRDLAIGWGAREVGICRLDPAHVYSHVGRGTGAWGSPIALEHEWAIAFTVEMDHRRVAGAPRAPVIAESARQYAESARVAVQLAAFLRRRGWPARAHIDGNYRVIAPLVARDAGLGEIGRMGLVMTPSLGPRVRLGVVTTTAPLAADPPGDDPTVLDFCTACRKCAEACPVGAIPIGDRESLDGCRRWRLDADACFRYWNLIGTDCAVCMRVCPYSHPDTLIHHPVRWAIRRSVPARRAALWLDDLFYGRRPARHATLAARGRG